jgi:hypothetical protein
LIVERIIEISLGDVTDLEAHVLARFRHGGDAHSSTVLQGTLRGPYCEIARTLPAEFEFRPLKFEKDEAWAEAVVTDPCMWSKDMPHFYHVNVEARDGERVVAEYHGPIGLRRTAPRRPVDFAPGTG